MSYLDTGYLDELPDALRDRGLEPVLVAGCQRRGRPFGTTIKASLDHHTASPMRLGWAPSLRVVRDGRSDLDGPLCQCLLPRLVEPDNRIYVVALGRANHAGNIRWHGALGNRDSVGLEREQSGYPDEPPTPWRNRMSAKFHAAVIDVTGGESGTVGVAGVTRHGDAAIPKGRKPDTFGITYQELQGLVRAELHTSEEDDFMALSDTQASTMSAAAAVELVEKAYELFDYSPKINKTDQKGKAYWIDYAIKNGGEKTYQVLYAIVLGL